MLYPYKKGSNSAKLLAAAIGVKQIKTEGSKFKGSKNKTVINWGASTLPDEVEKCNVINNAEAVKLASNKLAFFKAVEGNLQIPDFTTDVNVAKKWLEEGGKILGRTKLSGHSGEGIYYYDCLENFNNVNHDKFKLFVRYIPKKDEYRVHVVGDKVVDIRRKAARKDIHPDQVNWKIRSYGNGFVFAKEGVDADKQVYEQSLEAIRLCGLDFGAVDIVWNNFYKKAYVLEINTAPGLEGSTVDVYAENIPNIKMGKYKQQLIKDIMHENALYAGIGGEDNLPQPDLNQGLNPIPQPIHIDNIKPVNGQAVIINDFGGEW